MIARGINVAVIAPKWLIPKEININLSGVDAIEHKSDKADNGDGIESDGSGVVGKNGLPGLCGQSSGSFVGVCGSQTSSHDLEKFKFIVNGGKGGNGQHGGDGSIGNEGSYAESVYTDSKNGNYTGSLNRTIETDFGSFWTIKRNVKIFRREGKLETPEKAHQNLEIYQI